MSYFFASIKADTSMCFLMTKRNKLKKKNPILAHSWMVKEVVVVVIPIM